MQAEKDEMQIILDAQEGNKDAITQLVQQYEPLIRSLARRIHCIYIEKEELVQAGMVGFMQALKRYCVYREARLSTYAVPWILGEMKKALRQQALPDDVLSIDKAFDESGGNLHAVISCDSGIDLSAMDLRMAFEKLGQTEQLLICLRYYRGKTQKETAMLLGKSQAQISRMERTTLDKLHVLLS